MVKSTCCFSRTPRLSSQHLHGSFQPYVTPVPRDPMPSFALHGQALTWYKFIYSGNTLHLFVCLASISLFSPCNIFIMSKCRTPNCHFNIFKVFLVLIIHNTGLHAGVFIRVHNAFVIITHITYYLLSSFHF